jgi:hypothetical protein
LSLIAARTSLDGCTCPCAADPAPETTPSGLRGIPDADVAADPLSVALWSRTAAGTITLFVAPPDGGHGYAVSTQAWADGVPGFLPWDTLKTGRLVVARSLLGHGSLEVEMDGYAIFVTKAEFNRALTARPAARATVRAVVQSVIDAAESSGERPAARDLLLRVQQDPLVRAVSGRQIREIFNQLKPKEWTRPGRRKSL